jgi:UDP-glucuronate decarboxylase
MYLKNRVLVTGGAGFLGRHLIKYLLKKGNEVICVDNFFTSGRDNIIEFFNNPNFELIRHDVTSPIVLEVDAIFNLACPASPIHYQLDPVQTIKTCVHGVINMLDLANKLKIPIFQASTSEVYGDPEIHPQAEDYWGHVNPIGPRSCYDEGKRCAEALMFAYHKQANLRIKVGRIFNTYGPFMHPNDGRVVSNFVVQALRSAPITIYGDGSQSRSFCYVDDLVELMVLFMDDASEFLGPMNMGSPYEFTMLELAKIIIELTGSKSSLIHMPLPVDDPMHRRPNIDVAKLRYGWTPKTQLRDGLSKTIEYFDTLFKQDFIRS